MDLVGESWNGFAVFIAALKLSPGKRNLTGKKNITELSHRLLY